MSSNLKQGKVPNLPVYDEFELKALIKKAKQRKHEVQVESTSLAIQLKESQAKYESYKVWKRAADIDDEIKQLEMDDCSVALDKKFLEADRKLTIQILNADIKMSLPKLEQLALNWELKMHGYEKIVQKSRSEISVLPTNLLKSKAELLSELNSLTEEKSKLLSTAIIGIYITNLIYFI